MVIINPVFAESTSNENITENGEKIEEVVVFGNQLYSTVPINAVTATKSNLAILDTPSTISVVGRELIDAQNAVSLQEVIRNASGINQAGNNYGIGDFLSSRGLPVSYGYDGMYGGAGLGPSSYASTRSLTNVERVEVLQGANATLYGAGSAGGIINLIEKKPEYKAAYNLEARLGSYDTHGLMFDATGPLNDVFAYRFVGSHYRKEGFRGLGVDRDEIYGSISAKFSDISKLTLSTAHIDDSVQVDSVGYPVRIFSEASTGGISAGDVTANDLPNDPDSGPKGGVQLTDDQRQQLADSLKAGDGIDPYDLGDASLISPISRPNEGKETRIKLRWEWSPADNLTVTPSTQYRSYESEYVRQTGAFNYVYWNRRGVINANPRAPLIIDGVLYPFAARRQEYRKQTSKERSWDNFIDVKYQHNLFSAKSETLMTAYLQKIDMDIIGYSLYDADSSRSADNPIPYILDIRNPNFPTGSFEDYDTFLSTNYEKEVTTKGLGFQNVTYITPQIITRAGVGFNKITQNYKARKTDRSEARDPVDQSDHGRVFNLGLTYKPTKWLASFIALAKGRTAYSLAGSLNGTSDRPDTESTNFEAGFKVQSSNQNITASLSYFDTARTNLRYNNPEFEDDPGDPNFNISVAEYLYDGEDKTKGAQLDVNSKITETLFININATYQDARNRRNPTSSSSFDTRQKGVPQSLASVFAIYSPTNMILGGKWKYSLGYEYQDERGIASSGFGLPDAILPSQSLWDAGITYDYQDKWSLKLKIHNLTDELAYTRAMFLGGQPTAPRSYNLVFGAKW